MSDEQPTRPVPPPTPPALAGTPNAERYVLEADAMRRRQLRSALLHGSRRTWREHPRTWPAVVIGLVVAAVIVAGLAVAQALDKTVENQEKQKRAQAAVALVRAP
ncbi:hypothetical protein [Aeromicrobium massiliense]|uniref:hypothetical protein n=1 Tax=Aeromicrobium massiliense TaxID=1464554 RepID=UPI00030C1AC3|nr:hypothetical protein [Aeromicrobium massiliense]